LIKTRANILLSISLLFLILVFQAGVVKATEPMAFDGLIEPYLVVEVGSSVAGVTVSGG